MWPVIVLLAGAWLASCRGDRQEGAPPQQRQVTSRTSITDLQQDDGQWVMAPKNYAATRFSGLTDITTENVARLKLAWSFSTGVVAGHEAAPLVVGGTMYVVTPYPNILYALDLTEPAGRVKWKYESRPMRAAQGVACCDVVNRGAACADGKIFYNTLDNHTVAVDAESGKEVWKTQLGDINLGESMTMAPLVVKDKVLVGNSGGEFGVRGWLTALDTSSGSIAWRAYSTGPDTDVLIGEDFRPFYEQDRGTDLGVTTWPPDMWKIGGGTVWGWIRRHREKNHERHHERRPDEKRHPAQRHPGRALLEDCDDHFNRGDERGHLDEGDHRGPDVHADAGLEFLQGGDARRLLVGMIVAAAMGSVFLVLKVVEYAGVPYRWDDHAYGSIVWLIIGFHAAHVGSVVLKSLVVAVLAYRGYFNEKRHLGVQINGIYWHFVVAVWIPLYMVLYWAPRAL